MTTSQLDARGAVAAIIARDRLVQLEPDDVERLVGLYAEIQPELAQLRAAEFQTAEPAVVFAVG